MELNELSTLTTHLREKSALDRNHIRTAIDLLLQEDVDQNGKADFLVALAGKGESSQELTDFVSYFRELARDPELDDFSDHAIDLCGTGGDKAGSFNVSTFVSFVLASAGVSVGFTSAGVVSTVAAGVASGSPIEVSFGFASGVTT